MFTRLREDVATIRERDPAARSAWEVLTCYPGLHALMLHRFAHACWRAKRYWLARFASQCKVYAPLYRQVTLTQLRAATAGSPMPIDRACPRLHRRARPAFRTY